MLYTRIFGRACAAAAFVEVCQRVRHVRCNKEALLCAKGYGALWVAKERCQAAAGHMLVHEAGRLQSTSS